MDIDYVRLQFPAFMQAGLTDRVFCENAGGSYPCGPTVSALHQFYQEYKVQPYHPNFAAQKAGDAMDRSYEKWASALGVTADEVIFGPSTSANTYMLAQSLGEVLQPGDEVIVTNQDHEANSGVFRRMAEAKGLVLKEWRICADTQDMALSDLENLLSEKTALVSLPHCSNILGRINPIRHWIDKIQDAGAGSQNSLSQKRPITIVDGVSHAPHEIPNIEDLGCDIYLFSLYKVYSVHQGLMVVRKPLNMDLPNQGHFFNDGNAHYRLNPAGPDHAQIGSASAVLDYLCDLASHHKPDQFKNKGELSDLRQALDLTNQLWASHEHDLMALFLDFVNQHHTLRLIGPATTRNRHPTFALTAENLDPEAMTQQLDNLGIMAGAGNFYAYRLLEGLGLDPEKGVIRISLVHYNTVEEVTRICRALDECLS